MLSQKFLGTSVIPILISIKNFESVQVSPMPLAWFQHDSTVHLTSGTECITMCIIYKSDMDARLPEYPEV